MDSYNPPNTKLIYRGIHIVWYILGLLEVLMAFRFVLKLLSANPEASFTKLIYNFSYPFVTPFISVFHVSQVEGSVFEWTTLLAMLVYLLIAWGIVKLFSL
jgi:hypothetical protein